MLPGARMCVGAKRDDNADEGATETNCSKGVELRAECGASPLSRDGDGSPPASSADGSEGGGPSSAHLLDSYLERMYDSIL